MRDWPPDMKLLSLLVGLALLAAVAVGLGLGRQPGLLAEDPDLLPPLIDQRELVSASRPGRLEDYAEIWERPLFQPDRRPAPVSIATDDRGRGGFEPMLTGVLVSGDLRVAVVKDAASDMPSRHVRVGESIPDHPEWRLVRLDAREAVFEGPGGQRTLPLRTYEGSGSTEARRAGMGVRSVRQEAGAEPEAERQPDVETAQGQSEEEVVEAIRRRIEARRQALREQAASQTRQEQ